jgi:membrane fusion protein (multidrug efflux system)
MGRSGPRAVGQRLGGGKSLKKFKENIMSQPPIETAPDIGGEPLPRKPIYRRPIGIILLLVVLVGLGAGTAYWIYTSQWEETDDAFIDGSTVRVGTKVAGIIDTVLVSDNQLVKAGDLLAKIDPRDIQARLAQAQAGLEAARAEAEAAKTEIDLTRANTAAMTTQAQAGVASASAAVETAQSQLASARADVTAAGAEATRRAADEKRYAALDPRGVSQAQLDAARAAADAADAQLLAANKRVAAASATINEAKAKVAAAQGVLAAAKTAEQQIKAAEARYRFASAKVGQAQALLDAAKLDLSYATITAPSAGIVTHKNIQPGQYIDVGQTLLTIVPQDYWVTANFKETQLTHIRVGQPVEISVDAFPDRVFHGRVQSIQAGTGSHFSLLPPENATGNFVKVVQRVPVKIVFDDDDADRHLLGLGMSVVPEVRIRGTAKPAPATIATVK